MLTRTSYLIMALLSCAAIVSLTLAQQPPSRQQRPRVVIIGGGISGLTAAWKLKQSLGEEVDIKVVEADYRLGGRIFTIQIPKDS